MTPPNRADFKGWIDWISQQMAGRAGLSVRGDAVSIRDKLRIERGSLLSDLHMIGCRVKESDGSSRADLRDYIKGVREEIAEHFQRTAFVALAQPEEAGIEMMDDLASFGKMVCQRKLPRNYDNKIFVGNILIRIFLPNGRWPTRSELMEELKRVGREPKNSSLADALDFFDVAALVQDKRGPKRD